MSKTLVTLTLAALLFSWAALADSVLWNVVEVRCFPSDNAGTATWTMWTDEDQCNPSVALSVAFHSDATGQTTLRLYGGYSVLWPLQIVSLVQYGEIIDSNSIKNPDRVFLDNCLDNSTWHDKTVANDSSIIFGFFTGTDGLGELDNEWAYYGWVMFQFSNGELSLVSSAIAIDADGIYAGTGTVVPHSIPEPSNTALLLLGLAAVVARRPLRHRKIPDRR